MKCLNGVPRGKLVESDENPYFPYSFKRFTGKMIFKYKAGIELELYH